MKNYTLTVKHDNSKSTVKTSAENEAAARAMVRNAYCCPECAIVKVTESDILYKVVKIFRVSRRRQILARHLSLDEARRMVNSFPDSSRSMVCFFNQNKFPSL